MNYIEPLLVTAGTALVSAVVGAVVATVISAMKAKAADHTDQSKAMREGMSALLWRELKNIHNAAIKHNGMTLEERRQLEYVYSAYSGLGYNGTGKRLFEESMKMPIID